MEISTKLLRTASASLGLATAFALGGCASLSGTQQSHASAAAAPGAPPTELITPQLIAAQQRARESVAVQDLSRLVVPNPPPYRIDSGDILSIVVWDHPELGGTIVTPASGAAELANNGAPPSGFVVDHDGQVQFPFAGKIKLAGLTEDQARDMLANRLARYIARPNVTLRVQA